MTVAALLMLVSSVYCDVSSFKAYVASLNSYNPPEIISNGYHYPVPNPPIGFDDPEPPGGLYGVPSRPNASLPPLEDEIPVPIPTYLPPMLYPPLATQPPQFDPIPTDDTIVIPAPGNQYLPPPSPTYGVPRHFNPSQIRILNMSCLDTSSRRFFKAIFRTLQPPELPPTIEGDDSQGDCVVGSGDRFRVDWEGNKMVQCGVKYCPTGEKANLCVTLRMPSVKGVKLPEDGLVTLQCRPQESVVAHTKQFRINSVGIQGRSASAIATGGSQRNFEMQVGLFRKAPGTVDFTQSVTPGSAVPLGEDLLLKASVRDGDGWKYSRMGTVSIHRIASSKASQNSVTLVDGLGCRNPTMKGVCPEHPRQISPLVTALPFRAFMFQGSKSGDEMVLSVRMIGCLQFEDCQQTRCEDTVSGRYRAKRETDNNQNMTDWQSFLEFKVVLPEEFNAEVSETSEPRAWKWNMAYSLAVLGGLGALLLSTGVLLILHKK